MANNYPLPFLCMVLFGEVFFSVFSSALGCLSRYYSCHPFVSQFFDVILEKFQPITLHSIRSWTPMGTFLVCWVTILVVICMWSCFISFLSELNSFSHLAFLLWLFPVPQMLFQNLLLSSVSDSLLLSSFRFSCRYTLFWFCWSNLLILYYSIIWSYFLKAHRQISKKRCFKKYCSYDKVCQFPAL